MRTLLLALGIGLHHSYAQAQQAYVPPGDCNFERGMCGWKESGKHAFTRASKTPSANTGAAKAHGGKYFVFLETSSGHIDDTSYMISPKLYSPTSMSFWYHMHGKAMGSLSVQAKTKTGWTNVWSKQGQQQASQSTPWHHATVRLPPGVMQIRIKGSKGGEGSKGYMGDMSVDDIIFRGGSVISAYSGPCTFEKNTCGWYEHGKNAWTRGTKTPSGGTGANKAAGGKCEFCPCLRNVFSHAPLTASSTLRMALILPQSSCSSNHQAGARATRATSRRQS
jgi:hypothetical protein